MSNSLFHNSAIVLGTEVNGLAVIRSLGRLGVRCAAICTPSSTDHAQYSRYLCMSRDVEPDASDAVIISAIHDVAETLGGLPAVLLPTTDRFSEFIARNEDTFKSRFVACNPRRDICDSFLDKWRTAELCRRHGILIPTTACPQTAADLEKVAAEIEYPVIVKPRLTFGTDFPGKNATLFSARQLAAFFECHAVLGRCVVQQVIPSGDGDILVTATYSNLDGRVLATYSGRKLRQYLPDYGATCFGVSQIFPELEAATQQFLNTIGYSGFAALEFARSRKDGRVYFLELNTRTYYHNQLFADAGMDLTQIAYLDAIGSGISSMPQAPVQREGLIWLDFRRDYQSMRLKRRAGQLTVFGWLQSIAAARSFAVWNWRDPLPFLRACAFRTAELSRNFLRVLTTRQSGGSRNART